MTLLSVLLSDAFTEELLPQKIQYQNWGFILFLICFFISIHSLGRGSKLLNLMLKELFRGNRIERVFAEQINNEFVIKLLLCLQTTILSSIILFQYFSHQSEFPPETNHQLFYFLAASALLIIVFLLYKLLSCIVVGDIFFEKENVRRWNDHFISLFCLSGFVLFFPTLFSFYMDDIYYFSHYFSLIYLIFACLVLIYKVYTLFFRQKIPLLYFILYLCAQEIIPLYFLYRGLDYLFSMVQREILFYGY